MTMLSNVAASVSRNGTAVTRITTRRSHDVDRSANSAVIRLGRSPIVICRGWLMKTSSKPNRCAARFVANGNPARRTNVAGGQENVAAASITTNPAWYQTQEAQEFNTLVEFAYYRRQ
jgi:hypothetical protein